MRWMSDLWFRLRAVFDRRRMERDMDDEFAFHLEMEERKYRQRGLDPREARRRARVRFGGVDRHKEKARTSWGVDPLRDLGGDVRYAVRQLRKHPAFGALSALTLALGIGGTVALSSVGYGLLLRPLPFADEDRLAVFWSPYNWRGVEFDFAADNVQAFDGLAAFSNESVALRGDGGTSMLLTTVASAELFDVLGARPLLGRTFQPGDDRPGAAPSIVLSHGLWSQEFGSDPDVVGRRIEVDGVPTTVIGVMPAGFFFPNPEMRAWTPLELDPASDSYQGNGWLVLVGRTAAGVGPDRLQADLDALGARLGERFDYPERWDKSRNPSATPVREYLLGEVRPALLLLVGAVGVLLVMACSNVAALILTRTMDRTGELSVRAALGAGRGRLARQILTESLLLGTVGGVLGLGLAAAGFDVLVASLPLSPGTQGFTETLSLDWVTLSGALLLSILAGGAISLAPIRSLLRGDLSGVSLGERRPGGMGVPGGRVQRGLVVSEVLLSVVLVAGAALLVRSVDRLRAIDPGLDPTGVLTVDLHLGRGETTEAERAFFFESMLARTRTLPGVTHAGLINRLPIRDGGYQAGVSLEGRPDLVGEARPSAYYRSVSPGTLEALGVRPVQGRAVRASDGEGAVHVALVNESFVRAFWPDGRAVGRHFTTSFLAADEWEVVGVIPDMAIQGLLGEVGPAGYHPWDQSASASGSATLVVRVDGDEAALAAPLRRLARELDPRAAVGAVGSMQDVVDASMSESLRLRFFLTLFAVLGLVLGTVGIYGVVSYGVEQRRAEFGIRMALGANPGRLLQEVVRGGMVPVVVGVAGGVVVALLAARAAAAVLYEVAPADPLALGVAASVLLLAGALAALVPALRASRTPPGAALRTE